MSNMYGSICLSDIPRQMMKKVMCKDGKERIYLNVKIVERKQPSQYGHTHFITCEPKKEERQEGVNYIFGDLKTFGEQQRPTTEDVNNAPAVSDENDLPF